MNNTHKQKQIPTAEKFHSAEQMWFWFLYSRQIRNGFATGKPVPGKRICEPLDIETLITRLYLSGTLDNDHLNVMKEFGDRRRPPHQHIWSENHAAAIWRDAMQILESAAVKRGWIE